MTHPITPPPKLVSKWLTEAADLHLLTPSNLDYLATQAAQWGADQELEACCRWLPKLPPWSANDLRKHRRPKPPSLKEQALAALEDDDIDVFANGGTARYLIRRALESLDD